jgi:hypothetical protein
MAATPIAAVSLVSEFAMIVFARRFEAFVRDHRESNQK